MEVRRSGYTFRKRTKLGFQDITERLLDWFYAPYGIRIWQVERLVSRTGINKSYHYNKEIICSLAWVQIPTSYLQGSRTFLYQWGVTTTCKKYSIYVVFGNRKRAELTDSASISAARPESWTTRVKRVYCSPPLGLCHAHRRHLNAWNYCIGGSLCALKLQIERQRTAANINIAEACFHHRWCLK